uniref:Integrase, catalytic region, zinc finger, CCHC-type, peptidase aspartic, catalytic n=1 Tax=Tanacetum cinerariifolium TaxID=118510 RepID=A0A6L2P779_TANCI|nr:hypothetical protein [Tanacetum cinerariifolium]
MAADYGHIKRIEDLFYRFTVNRESARDVYSKRRIIAVTELQIVEWHDYKHLDCITVRRDDDKLYKFKEGDLKRLRIQDIEDMLLLLVQGKLTNLTVEERFAFNVSLRMFTRSIIIQRHVEDLQQDNQNRLMQIDELHKFIDGTLNDVRTAQDDRLKGIQMKYLPQAIWRKSDKERVASMIQAIDKQLKTRRIMRSLEKLPNDIYSLIDSNKTAKDLWDALASHMLGSEYGEQDRKATILYEYETFKATEGELLLDTYIRYLQNKNLMDINIDALYNILKQNQGDVNDAIGSKKKTVVVTTEPLALIAKKTNASRSKEKVVVSLDSEGSETDDFNELKKITALLAKAFNRRKFYSKPTNNNLRTSSSSQSANKKQEFVKTDNKRVEKKDDEKKRDMSRTKMLLAKKDKDKQVLLAEDQAWMESSSDSDQEINANMVFMAQIEKVLFDSEVTSSSANEKISEVSYYLSESKSESEFETLEYYDNYTNYGLFVNNDDDQENFQDAIESASENFIENHINSLKDYDKSDVDHTDSEEKDQLVDKLIRKFNKKIVKCQKRIEKSNQQSKNFENQNKDLQNIYDILKNQTTNFEMNNNKLNEQMKELIEKNNDLLTQTKVLKDQLQVKHVVINTHVECQEKYAKLKAERYEYMIRYSAYFDNDKQHKKQTADQQVLYDKMSVQLVELDKHVRDLKNTVLEKDFKISELEECDRNKDLEI